MAEAGRGIILAMRLAEGSTEGALIPGSPKFGQTDLRERSLLLDGPVLVFPVGLLAVQLHERLRRPAGTPRVAGEQLHDAFAAVVRHSDQVIDAWIELHVQGSLPDQCPIERDVRSRWNAFHQESDLDPTRLHDR